MTDDFYKFDFMFLSLGEAPPPLKIYSKIDSLRDHNGGTVKESHPVCTTC